MQNVCLYLLHFLNHTHTHTHTHPPARGGSRAGKGIREEFKASVMVVVSMYDLFLNTVQLC